MKIASKDFDPKKIFFTADTHFGHSNIIKYCNRPFKDVDYMNETMIDRWNMVVPDDGIVFHLGDFAMGMGDEKIRNILLRLGGTIYFCMGNHDKTNHINLLCHHGYIEEWADVMSINIRGQKIFMSHYAHKTWPSAHKGSWHLYGHSHGTLSDDKNSLSMDVGVDTHMFSPWSYSQIQGQMNLKTFKPIDKHGTDYKNTIPATSVIPLD